MRAIVFAVIMSAMGTQALLARGMQIWCYDDLAKKADLILIVSVSKPSERTGAQEMFYSRQYDKVRTDFRVHAVLKGEYKGQMLELQHLANPKEKSRLGSGNGWGFGWFGESDEMYLVFLKTSSDGGLVPVSGQEDLNISFVKLPPDLATKLKPNAQSGKGE